MDYKILANGVKMPMLGYGVYQVPVDETERAVREALSVGYRHIDTAQAYHNEAGVGNAIKQSGTAREEIFITTKIWVSSYGYEAAKRSIEESLSRLQTDYIDLLLLHQPFGDYYGAWRAMEEAYQAGKVRALGVSNFSPDRFIDLYHFVNVKPVLNQIETHPFHQRTKEHEWMDKYHIAHESWGPFAEGRRDMFTNETLAKIGAKYDKSVAQTILRFLIQSDIIVIPKSSHKDRMAQNFDVFDFSLTDEDMATIRQMNEDDTAFFDHTQPETVEQFMAWV